jgi:hypothetical protein
MFNKFNVTMRRISIIFGGLLIFCQLSAQNIDTLSTDMFISLPGVLIEKRFISIGNVDEIDVRLIIAKDLVTGNVKNAIRMEYLIQGEIVSHPKISNIESNEIDGLISAINIINNELLIDSSDDFKEITFKCKSGLVLGAFFNVGNKKWSTYIQLDRNDPKSTVNIGKEEFDYFVVLLKKAKAMMVK